MRISRARWTWLRLCALVAALALVSSVALAKRGLVRCATDGSWHLVACCAELARDSDVTADEPTCCDHVAVDVADLAEHAAPAIALPSPTVTTTLFAAARWGTLDDTLAGVRPPSGPPPPRIADRLALLSTLRR
ncbi:MAG: hypothetical protein IT374_21740 [Polyangiaceae bacterium]|nr:hypothetical protein [Polyangiaceae bacterium]